jgi:glutathione S-transferase
MITVHHLNNSRSQRVLWLLEELGVPYEVKRYERDAKTMLAPPELRAIHPLGKSPVVTDGARTVAESGAILEYLVDTHGDGRLRPAAGTDDRLRYTYYLHYAEGSVMPPLLLKLVASRIASAPVPFFLKPVTKGIAAQLEKGFIGPQVKTHFDFIEGELGKSTWFAGEELTAADVQMSFPLEAAVARAGAGEGRPKIRAFVERIRARAAYKRALERGGPFEILG